MNQLLDRIYDLLDKHEIKPAQLVNELGLSNSAFSDWKKGKGRPSLDAVVKFAEYFDVSIDYLVKGENYIESHGVLEISDKNEKELMSIYKKLPSELKEKLLLFAKGMDAALPVINDSEEKRLSV